MVGEALCWAAAAAFLAIVWFVFVGHLPRSDFVVFLRAGGRVIHGLNPYPALGTPSVYSGSAFVYPWLTAFLFAPFAVLPAHAADIVFFALSGLAVIGGCRLAGLKDPVSVILVLTAATTIRGFQVGSLNAILFLGCILAWRFRDRHAIAAIPLAIVVSSKLFLLPLLGWIVLSKRWSLLARTLVGMFILFAGSFAIGPLSAGAYMRLLGALATHEGVQGFSLYGMLAQFEDPLFAKIVCAAVAGCFVAVGWWASRGRGERGEVALFGACIAAALVITPVLWSHYIVLALVPVIICRPRRMVLAGVALASWIVAGPASIPQIFGVSGNGHVLLLYGALVGLVGALVVRATFPPVVRPDTVAPIGSGDYAAPNGR